MDVIAKTPEQLFLDEAVRVIAAINARTHALLVEYEHIKRAMDNEPKRPVVAEDKA